MTILSKDDIERYSRQLLMPEVGVKGQEALQSTSVLIIGAGGLGAPVSLYLAAAGIGKLGILDYDIVERENLHRQIIHRQSTVGVSKVFSAASFLNDLNSTVQIDTFNVKLDKENAIEIFSSFDIVVDASDNPPTRYLVNDVCILLGLPLVSGSALRMEGQLTVYGWKGGPCYRCLYPVPPSAENVTNCSDGGVLGCITGVIGSLQALETIKIAICMKSESKYLHVSSPSMLVFDGANTSFRNIRLRSRQRGCAVCGDEPTISLEGGLINYEQFCGSRACDGPNVLSLLSRDQRLSCKEYAQEILDGNIPHRLIDVRPEIQFDICHLSHAINIPLERLESSIKDLGDNLPIYICCRRGNASQEAVRILSNAGIVAKDIIGGMTSWSKDVDEMFPIY